MDAQSSYYCAMWDLKILRHNPELLDECLRKRGIPGASVDLMQWDQRHRLCLQDLEQLRAQKNTLDQAFKKAQKNGNEEQKKQIIAQSTGLKAQEAKLLDNERTLAAQVHERLAVLPNQLCPDVPQGADETSNRLIHTWGTPRSMPWARDHMTLGACLGAGGMDFTQSAHVAGSRFVYLAGQLARLERALGQWMLDVHTQEFGFTEMSVPYLVKPEALFGTGQLPKFGQDLFATTDGRYLIPTAEVSLANWVAGKTLSAHDLPLCLTALTPCFRSEAGSAGRDTTGMIRNHQFHKVELVVICAPDQAEHWHHQMVNQAETLLQRLELPYRKMLLCAGDTGASACKTFDLEVWLPSQNTYREIASCSQCGTYQARRMHTKYRPLDGLAPQFVHTLNGSGLPTGRTLLALMENHQDESGDILVPEVLHPYTGGISVLRART